MFGLASIFIGDSIAEVITWPIIYFLLVAIK